MHGNLYTVVGTLNSVSTFLASVLLSWPPNRNISIREMASVGVSVHQQFHECTSESKVMQMALKICKNDVIIVEADFTVVFLGHHV